MAKDGSIYSEWDGRSIRKYMSIVRYGLSKPLLAITIQSISAAVIAGSKTDMEAVY